MRRRARWVVALAAIAAALAAIAAVALRHERDGDDLRPLLQRVVATGVPGALVVVRDGSSTRRWEAGLADRDARVAMTSDARFRVGSITKTFVATVVLQLVAEGRLGLDDRIGRLLPGLPSSWRGVAVRRLLNHTSGLPDFVRERGLPPLAHDPGYAWRPRELLSLAARRALTGERFSYASTNYVVLGLLVEAVTGHSLASALGARIVRPLALRHTAFDPGAGIRGPHAHGYVSPVHDGVVLARDGGFDHDADSASWAGAAGAIVSNADDLARFYAALLGGRLLPAGMLAVMERTVPAERLRYGLGLAALRTPCGTAWGHTGDLLGYISAVLNTRDGRRQAVVMVNSEPLAPDAEAAVRRLLDAAFCGRG